MNNNSKKIESFTDLNAWKEAHKLVLMIYKITKDFPKEEIFGLTSQIRRAVVSITSNIAEGFSRQTYKEKIQFYHIAKGSLTEVQDQLLIARDLNYINKQDFNDIANQSVIVHKLLNGLIKKSKDIQNSKFKIQNSSKGFSLIEILVVISVISIVLSITIVAGRNFSNSIDLENTVKSIDMKIKLAKSRSISALNGTNHGVHFEADKIVVFEGDTFDALASTNEVFTFSDNIKINTPVILVGGGNDLIFNRLVGSTNNSGNISVEVINDPSKTKQIVINSNGQTSPNSFQDSIEPLVSNARHVHFNLGWNIEDSTELSLKWVDESDVQMAITDINIASYFDAVNNIFDWTGTTSVDGVDQEMRIHSWLDTDGYSVLCIIREQTENDKLYILTDQGEAGEKNIATYENILGKVDVTLDFDGGIMEIQ